MRKQITTKKLSNLFEQAKKNFEAGNYMRAQEIATEIAEPIRDNAEIKNFGNLSAKPKCSIIVLSYIHSTNVESLIDSLSKYTEDDHYEIILVNNGNTQLEPTARDKLKRFRFINIGFNYGSSGGRNIAAYYAKGDYVAFIDDDGVLAEGSIENLSYVIAKHNATAVRGKVVPRNQDSTVFRHKDLGNQVRCSRINTEGISIWHRERYNSYNGFDVLLSGHEGNLLCYRMLSTEKPHSFLYTPDATLFHDYAVDNATSEKKKLKHKNNEAYLDFTLSDWRKRRKKFRKQILQILHMHLSTFIEQLNR